MAIRADWDQVVNWIYLIVPTSVRELDDMVNMDKPLSDWSINRGKAKVTYLALISVVIDAESASSGISFVSIDGDLSHSPLG
jgi:hypothetical protein